MSLSNKEDIAATLKKDILRFQGFKPANHSLLDIGLGTIKNAFPNATFPLGAVHEFISEKIEESAATCGFVSGLLSGLMGKNGTLVWISASRTVFPPALKSFGIQPDRCIFVDLKKEKDVVWAMDESLKCGALSAVVGEVRDLTFSASRRLQLAVEQSQVTGFLLRNNYRNLGTTACISRWRITSLPSESIDDLPGIGYPKWHAELLRIRNGQVGSWNIRWINGKFEPMQEPYIETMANRKKAG